jgi:hypothetical protein
MLECFRYKDYQNESDLQEENDVLSRDEVNEEET